MYFNDTGFENRRWMEVVQDHVEWQDTMLGSANRTPETGTLIQNANEITADEMIRHYVSSIRFFRGNALLPPGSYMMFHKVSPSYLVVYKAVLTLLISCFWVP
jgi:hypothetical protein